MQEVRLLEGLDSDVAEFIRLLVKYADGRNLDEALSQQLLTEVIEAFDRLGAEKRREAVELLVRERVLPKILVQKEQ